MEEKVDLRFKVGDRVFCPEIEGPYGTVEKVRVETTVSSIRKEGRESPGVTVSVLWDNGTRSHFVPESLKLA